MRYPASEKLEIIRLVERSHLPTKRTLAMLGIPRTTFYRWYDRYIALGEAGLEDRPSHPGRAPAVSMASIGERRERKPQDRTLLGEQMCYPVGDMEEGNHGHP